MSHVLLVAEEQTWANDLGKIQTLMCVSWMVMIRVSGSSHLGVQQTPPLSTTQRT